MAAEAATQAGRRSASKAEINHVLAWVTAFAAMTKKGKCKIVEQRSNILLHGITGWRVLSVSVIDLRI